jgi:hypothetical protein
MSRSKLPDLFASDPERRLALAIVTLGREVNDEKADYEEHQRNQRRSKHSVHVRFPRLRTNPSIPAVTLIPRLAAKIPDSIIWFSTSQSSSGNTAHRTLNSMNHSDIASRRASLSVTLNLFARSCK